MTATATSSGNTEQEKAESGQDGVEKPVDTRIKLFSSGNTSGCMQNRESEGD